MKRRKFIQNSGLMSGSLLLPSFSRAADGWSSGSIQHLIPLVNSNSLMLKVSFSQPQFSPVLRVGRNRFPGQQADTLGRFWSFRATGLESNQEYELMLLGQDGTRFADPWPLKTAPAENDSSESVRLLIFSCAGGPDNAMLNTGDWRYLPVSIRQRIFRRALSFAPDLAIGIGDQVYWDQSINSRRRNPTGDAVRELIWGKYGKFDEDLPIFGSDNEATLTGCLDEQLASLYSTDFRSVPLILTQDDHDYFENDEGTDDFITFPPRNFSAQLAKASQSLYFPEFLPDQYRPTNLAGSTANGLNESYGSYRWGSLLEVLMYDCRRFLSLKGPTANFVEEQAERWLARRTEQEKSARHLIHIPSTPFGWSAGKWGEWYPDYLQSNGQLGLENPKPYWQSGWFQQHQRILSSLAAQDDRIPLIISGDLHAIGSGLITRSGDLNFDRPVNTILAGPIGTGTGWPSNGRGIASTVPSSMTVEERVSPIENNGFSILDIDQDSIEVKQFAWLPEMGLEALDSLQPFSTFRLIR